MVEAMLSLNKEQISEDISIGAKSLSAFEKFDYKAQEIATDFKNYQEALSSTLSANLALVDQLPPLRVLTKAEIKEKMASKVKSNLENDELFEKTVTIKKYTKDFSRYVINYFAKVFEQNQLISNRLNSELFELWRSYYNSDLPLCYIEAIEKAILLQLNYLHLYGKYLRRERVQLLINRDNKKKFEHLCNIHNKWVEQFDDIDRLEDNRIKLFWYIDFCNCEKVDEILKVKKIKTEYLQLKELDNFVTAIYAVLEKLEPMVDSNLPFEHVAPYEDDGIRTISKIAGAISEMGDS
ncbi:MAG: hypothetical protein NWE92_11870 [Candidatus Bathyarchaeota archaeon]|nr:hypothetical protein [Candidatus Bathyarchaeota archaeon]